MPLSITIAPSRLVPIFLGIRLLLATLSSANVVHGWSVKHCRCSNRLDSLFTQHTSMRRRYLPIEQLHAWATLNGVTFVNTRVERLSNTIAEGAGFFANCDFEINEHYGTVLLSVPPDLVLSKDLVAEYAKSDRHLRDVLEAVGEFGRVCQNSGTG